MSNTPTRPRALLRPEDNIFVLIDHQPHPFTNPISHESTMLVNNLAGLAP